MNPILLVYINASNLLDMGYFLAEIDIPIVFEKAAFEAVALEISAFRQIWCQK